jgi:hypothetical protein
VWTAFDYLYRDAGNFKAFGNVLLDGSVTEADEQVIRQILDAGEHFIAEQVGVPPLYAQLYRWSDGPTDSDHCWHEFVGLRRVPERVEPMFAAISVREFVARFALVEHWDESLSPHFWLAESVHG